MADIQLENGYTRIANEILEHLVNTALLGSEWQILVCIIRKTYGFQKREDKISLTQFQRFTKLSRPTVVKGIKNLIHRGILVKTALLGYMLEKDWENWVVNTALLVKHNDPASKDRLTKIGKHGFTHKRKKETYTKEIIYGADALNQINEIIKAFESVNPAYTTLYANKTERGAVNKLISLIGFDKLKTFLLTLPKIISQPYAPKPTTPYQLLQDMGKLKAFIAQEGQKQSKHKITII